MPDRAPTTNLRLEEARARADLITVHHTTVELDLTGAETTFGSSTTIEFGCRKPGSSTFVDFKGELLGVRLNGTDLPTDSAAGGRIEVSDLQAENVLEIEGLMSYSSDGEGLHKHVDPVDQRTYLYAMSFLDAAPKWFACFDQPDLKSRYRFEVTAPQHWTVVGNGPSRRGEPGHWRIEPPHPLSTYFVTLVAGDYASVHAEHDGVLLAFHVRESLRAELEREAADLIEVTGQCLDYYHATFGVRYPFGEYHQAFVPDFNAGAMENPGCVTLRDQFIFRSRATTDERASRAGVVAHEMAHMWFGDLVTMQWWDDLWLNESFAEYMAHRCCTDATRYPLWAEFGIVRKDWGSVADQASSTHPVAGIEHADAASALQDFDGIAYAKGAAVLRQLATYLGDDTFFGGLKSYFAAYAFGNATFADLIEAWSGAGARELPDWARAWLRTTGMDLLSVDEGRLTRTAPDATSRSHALSVGYFAQDGTELGRQDLHLSGADASLDVPTGTELVLPDVGDQTWARIRFGAGGFERAGTVVPRIAESSARVVAVNAVRDGVRAGELSPVDALRILLDLVASERSDVVTASTLRFAVGELTGPYVAPQRRPELLGLISATVDGLVADADPGSDHQLTLFRTAIRATADPALLRDQLAGRRLPRGLDLDSELSWAAVDRLVTLTGETEPIDRQLEADPSAAAHVHAARARAGRPDPVHKARAWRLLTEPSELGSYELYATGEGFFRPEQDELCRPYAARYFHEIPGVAAFRSGWVLSRLVSMAFPRVQSTRDVLDLAERALEPSDLVAGVRRPMADQTDGLRQAVRAREAFALG